MMHGAQKAGNHYSRRCTVSRQMDEINVMTIWDNILDSNTIIHAFFTSLYKPVFYTRLTVET